MYKACGRQKTTFGSPLLAEAGSLLLLLPYCIFQATSSMRFQVILQSLSAGILGFQNSVRHHNIWLLNIFG